MLKKSRANRIGATLFLLLVFTLASVTTSLGATITPCQSSNQYSLSDLYQIGKCDQNQTCPTSQCTSQCIKGNCPAENQNLCGNACGNSNESILNLLKQYNRQDLQQCNTNYTAGQRVGNNNGCYPLTNLVNFNVPCK